MNRQVDCGIWRFKDLLPPLPDEYKLSLNEGNTPLLKIDNICFKCEFENPTGSIKDRGMAYQISQFYGKNIKSAVLSSSGNAAIAAARYCRLADIRLTVFVSPKINIHKLKKLQKSNCQIIQTPKPISGAFRYAKMNSACNLRQSTDINASIGYSTLAFELAKEMPDIDGIFLPVSSGATLVGLARGFVRLKKLPAIHAVQTEAIHPIASLFDKDFKKRKKSLADAIVAKYSPLHEEVRKLIIKSKGWGWVIADKEMKAAYRWLQKNKLVCSYEGAAVLAALRKAKKNNFYYRNPVCVLTGSYYATT
ncbi:PLP-dependent lyase/thiolase [Candidatus Gottesmanbacteria bacterium]|nr:PLP-dependent lyase/thiolase [Candidatus Gottesmanbacteria bacterium]